MEIDFVRFLIYGFATYRITILFVKDDGPFDIFDWIRMKAGIRMGINAITNESEAYSEKMLGRILACVKCFSFYVLIPMFFFYIFSTLIPDYIVMFLALWGFAVFLSKDE